MQCCRGRTTSGGRRIYGDRNGTETGREARKGDKKNRKKIRIPCFFGILITSKKQRKK